MKKLLGIILCLMIFALPLCHAESDAAFEFTFRNGVKWGDEPHTVSASEPSSGERREYNNYLLMDYFDVNVSQYTGDLTYCFANEALVSCLYLLPGDSLDYLTGALSAKYGEPSETDVERATAILLAMDDIDETTFHSMWTLADNTCVLLFSFGYDSDLYLLYADEPALLAHANPTYDLSGL
jgi:hypothetical protein